MSEAYEIQLGIGLNDSDFESIKSKIKTLEKDDIKIKLDTNTIDAQIKDIKSKLQSLDGIKINLGTEFKIDGNVAIKSAQQTGQKIGTAISKSVKQSINIDDVIDKEVADLMKTFMIDGDKGSSAFKEIRQALVECRSELQKLKNSDIGIDEEVFDTSRAFDKVSDAIANQIKAVNSLGTEYIELAKYMREFNDPKKGNKVRVPDFVKQEQGDDYKSTRGSLGIAFNTERGISFASFIEDINDANNRLGVTIDLTKGEEKAYEELLHKVLLGREQLKASEQSERSLQANASTEEILAQNYINKNEIRDIAESSIDYINATEAAADALVQTSTQATNTIVQNEERKQQAYRETANVHDSTGKLDTFKKSLQNIGMGADEINSVASRISNLGVQIESLNQTRSYAKDKSILSVDISGLDEMGNAVKLTQQYDIATGDLIKTIDRVSTVQQKAGASTSNFAKQQKQAVSNLTNQINQINRAANDKNASRPIKDSSHLDALSSKYNEVTSAIQKMGNASVDTFSDEQNNVRTLISEYKSLVSEFRNAENVSSKMKGTDFGSGLDIARNDLEKFKAQAKDFPQITATIKELDNAIENVGDASALNKFNDQLRVARSELAKIKSETTAINRSEKVGINVSGLESKIADIQRISPEINRFETEINGVKVSVQSLLNDLKQVNTQSDFSVINSKFKAFADSAKAAGIAVSEVVTDTKAKLANKFEIKLETGEFNTRVSKIRGDLEKLSDASKNLPDLQQKLEALNNIETTVNSDSFKYYPTEHKIKKYNEYEKTLQSVENQLKQIKIAEQDAVDFTALNQSKANLSLDIDNWLKDNSAAAKDFGARLRELQSKINSCDKAGLSNLKAEFTQIKKEAQLTGKTTKNFVDKFKGQFEKYSSYLSIASIFMYATQGLKDMFNQVVAIDSAMTELKKVTDETDTSYDKFLSDAAAKSKELGTTIDALVSSTADFAKLGYGFEDAQGLAEVANVYAVVGDEIEGIEGATQSLISTMAAFKGEMNGMSDSDFAMSIVDKMNEVANRYSISSGGIGEALQRSASSMATAQNTLDETIALTVAANEVVQDPEKIGNAMKTISMRIRSAKTDMEEAGIETDGMVESTAKLRQEIMALSGVDIMLNEDTFKSTYQILDELSAKWEDLSDISRATIIELMAGKHQGNIFSSLMANFDVARNALETSINSSGSAMREHAKWSESLEARLNKLKSTWQSLSQTFMSSSFLKIGIDVITTFVDILDKLIDKIGTIPTILGVFSIGKIIGNFATLGSEIKSIGDVFNALGVMFPKLAGVFSGFFSTLASGAGVFAALKTAASGLWTVIAAHPILSIVAALGIAFVAFDKFTESADELAERIEGVTTKYKEQHDSLMKLKGDYDTSNESSMISKYGELSKGVNALGENISLTADEYAEYQGIVDTIANQFPSLVTGYNSQGDAILSCAGSVDKLSESYKNLIKEQNDEVLDTGKDIFKDFKNDLKETSAYFKEYTYDENGNIASSIEHYNTEHFDEIKKLMNLNGDGLEEAVAKLSTDEVTRVSGLLNKYGIERNVWGSGEAGWETQREHIIRALGKDKAEIKTILEEASADLDAYAEDMGTVTSAYFSTAFLGGDGADIGDFSHMSERMQSIITQITSGFGSEFYTQFLDDKNPFESLTKYYDSMLMALDSLDARDVEEFETAFDLRTKFNGGDISYGEYVNGIKGVEKLIDGLDLEQEVKDGIKLTLDTENVIDDYNALKERLTSDEYNIKMKSDEAEKFLNGLTASEYSVAIDLITSGKIDFKDFNIDSLKNYIEKEAKFLEAMNFTIAMDVETESLDALNGAMAESVSAVGLSSESIAALKGRYAELASQGYDLSAMFEETSNGIHLNRKAVDEFEQVLASKKLSEIGDENSGALGVLKDRYDELTKKIKNCNDASERANLYTEQQEVAQKINDLATLASQYEGLTSAYNAWLSAEEAGQERDMYENIIEGFENVGDEISRGWLDDGTIKFLEMLTGRTDLATLSAKELKEVYKGLDDTIKHTNYSVRDFFTVDEDGNSTSQGVYNFLDAVGQLEEEKFEGEDVVKRDKNGKIISFDFQVAGGDKAIADALGISEELVQIMKRAADDAGFVVTLDGSYTQLADLKTSAEAANDTLKKLKSQGLDSLKDTDLNFDFDANNLQDLNTQLEKAITVLDKFKDKNGQLKKDKDGNLVKGAKQALEIASYFTATLDKLTEPVYMQLETNQVEKDLQEPLEKMQKFERLSKKKHQLELTGDTDGIEEVEDEMKEIVDYIYENDDLKARLEIEGLSKEEIKAKLEKGEIEIPATVDIQLEMSEDIKDMRLMMMNQLGLISDEQLKLEIEYDVDYSSVEEYSPETQKAIVEYFAEHEEVDKYEPEDKKALVRLIAEKDNIDNWKPEDIDAVVKYYADDEQVKEWTPEEKKAYAKYLVDGGEVDGWSPEAKDAFVKYLVDGGDPDKFDPDDKESWVVYDADTRIPDGYIPNNPNALVTYNKDSSIPDTYDPKDPDATVKYGKDSLIPDNYIPLDPPATVVFDKDTSAVDSYNPPDIFRTVWYTVKETVQKIASGGKSKAGQRTGANPDGSSVNGTANVNGTAFAQGNWRTKKSETALTGELGREIVVTPQNQWYTVGDDGAEFVNIPRGSIVFNHKICGIA